MSEFMSRSFLLLLAPLFLAACGSGGRPMGPVHLPTHPVLEDGYQALVLTPAGANELYTYDAAQARWDTVRPVWLQRYLPTPAHQAAIMVKGNDGWSSVPVWVLGKDFARGSVVEIDVVAGISYVDSGGRSVEYFALPKAGELRTVEAPTFLAFMLQYDAVKFMLEYWFRNRQGVGTVMQLQWLDEGEAGAYLDRALDLLTQPL